VIHESLDQSAHAYEVVGIRPVCSATGAESAGRDPMALLLREQETGQYGL